jgi:hypothetical protein
MQKVRFVRQIHAPRGPGLDGHHDAYKTRPLGLSHLSAQTVSNRVTAKSWCFMQSLSPDEILQPPNGGFHRVVRVDGNKVYLENMRTKRKYSRSIDEIQAWMKIPQMEADNY